MLPGGLQPWRICDDYPVSIPRWTRKRKKGSTSLARARVGCDVRLAAGPTLRSTSRPTLAIWSRRWMPRRTTCLRARDGKRARCARQPHDRRGRRAGGSGYRFRPCRRCSPIGGSSSITNSPPAPTARPRSPASKNPHPPAVSSTVEAKLRNARSPRFDLDSVYGGSPVGAGITPDMVTVISGMRHPTLVNKMRVGTTIEPGPIPDGLDEHRDLPRYVQVQASVREAALRAAEASMTTEDLAKFSAGTSATRPDRRHAQRRKPRCRAVSSELPSLSQQGDRLPRQPQYRLDPGFYLGPGAHTPPLPVADRRRLPEGRLRFGCGRQGHRRSGPRISSGSGPSSMHGGRTPGWATRCRSSSPLPATGSGIPWSAHSMTTTRIFGRPGGSQLQVWNCCSNSPVAGADCRQKETSQKLDHGLDPVYRCCPTRRHGRETRAGCPEDRYRPGSAIENNGQGRQ